MATTPLSQAIMVGMDPNTYRSIQDMQTGDALTKQGLDGSSTTKWGAMGRLASALSGSYISNSAVSDLGKTVAAGKQAALDRDEQMLKGLSPAAQSASPSVSDRPTTMPSGWTQSSSSASDVPAAAATRAPVQSTPKVWGDQEAENAGLYDAPAKANVPQAAPKLGTPTSATPLPLQPPRMGSPSASTSPAGLRNAIAIQNDPYAGAGSKAMAQAVITNSVTPKDTFRQERDNAGNVWSVNNRSGERSVALKAKDPEDTYTQETDADGNIWSQNDVTHQRTVALKQKEDPTSVREYQYYLSRNNAGQEPMDYATWSTQRARAGATNVANNIDIGGPQSYDKQLAEGLGKSHAALSNGVEDAQSRARDLAAMQGAVDSIQQNGGTTGGMGAEKIQNLKKTINAGTSALGIDKPFNENDISDKEFLQKFNRQIAGAQAKNSVGNRVTNFEMGNYLKANPGLDMSLTGNQRLLGIQAQIEQRNIAVGNAIRNATAQAISKGQRIDPVTVQKIVTDYDEQHHVKDPVNGQDLTQSYTLPEFQGKDQGTNADLSKSHETNVKKIRRYNPATGAIE